MRGVVGVDASRAVREHRSGTENYSVQIINAMRLVDPTIRLRLYYPTGSTIDALPARDNDTEHVPVPGTRLWTHRHFAAELRRNMPDVLFVPAHVIPISHPRSVVTVHDLGYIHRPDDHPASQRAMLSLTTRWNVHAAKQVIVPSQFTADDLERRFPGSRHKTTVIHHGVSSKFRPMPASGVERTTSDRTITGRYVIAVGTIQPRKDYPTLARAIARHNNNHPDFPISIVIAGRPGWMVNEIMAELSPLRERARIQFVTNATDEHLLSLLSGAMALVQPSRFEGFGMPVLEAMACGIPVIAADNSSLPEILGDAGLLFPTGDDCALGSLIQHVARDDHLRTALSEMGLRRASRFTWKNAAEATLAVIDRAMHEP